VYLNLTLQEEHVLDDGGFDWKVREMDNNMLFKHNIPKI
jgi:hypothetical protein